MSGIFRFYSVLVVLGMFLAACAATGLDTPSDSLPEPDEPISPDPTATPGPSPTREEPLVPGQGEEPEPGEGGQTRGEIYIDSARVLVMESYPIQVALLVAGNKPTPCHILRINYQGPDDQNRIYVEIYTEVDPDVECAQVLEPFEENIPVSMKGVEDGRYTVWLNGEQVGEFNYPGG
jgi:hypothetical protein